MPKLNGNSRTIFSCDERVLHALVKQLRVFDERTAKIRLLLDRQEAAKIHLDDNPNDPELHTNYRAVCDELEDSAMVQADAQSNLFATMRHNFGLHPEGLVRYP